MLERSSGCAQHARRNRFGRVERLRSDVADLISAGLGISPDSAERIARVSEVAVYGPNSVIYFQEDETECLYLLLSGYVRQTYINENGVVTLTAMVPRGRSFGEAGLLDGGPHLDTAFTVGATDVVRITRGSLRQVMDTHAELRDALAAMVSRRYREYMAMTRALYLPSLSLRLAHVLLHVADVLGNQIRYRGVMIDCIGPIITQQDLGSMARGTRENVNKTLRGWERSGIIALEDRHILLTNRPLLVDIAMNADRPGGMVMFDTSAPTLVSDS
jgi:CRP/FNR family transcriptional regulator, cyclic AMP receptor protein